MNKTIDINGLKFGKWFVLEYMGKNRFGNSLWLCRCDCGNEKVLVGSELRCGRTKSCKQCVNYSQGRNCYRFENDYGVCTVANGNEFIFDISDFELIKKHTWHMDKNKYVRTRISGKVVLLHRLLLTPSQELQVDHINLDPSDNRRCNLRLATNKENVCNQPIDKENTSGYKGVTWHKMRKKWASQIHVNGKHKSLGLYENIIDAALAYNRAASIYFGEFARMNEVPEVTNRNDKQ